MLKNTFLHIPGVGPNTERRIWEGGGFSWADFNRSDGFDIPTHTKDRISEYLVLSESALRKREVEFFSRTLPKREWWRLYQEFQDSTAFVDIETTGLSFYYDNITLIGLFNGKQFKVYLRGQNLADFKEQIKKYQLLVTFNGCLFDLPFISSEFDQIQLPPAHIDLRFLLKRLGFTGGLKAIEKQLDIRREDEINGIDGLDATILWHRYIRGDRGALELLLKYNFADVTNLRALMNLGYYMMRDKLLTESSHLTNRAWPANRTLCRPTIKPNKELLTVACKQIYPARNSGKDKPRINIGTLLSKLHRYRNTPKAAGIDLRASEIRASGIALLDGKSVETRLIKEDSQIIDLMLKWKPDLISIDSPLSLPKGRDCVNDKCECRKFGITRECERILRSRNINVFWCLIQSMQGLTDRGMKLAQQLRQLGFQVIESYPGAAQDILGIARKKLSTEELKQGLSDFGLSGAFVDYRPTHDELDAITCALVGYFYLSGCYEALGNTDEGYLIIPKSYKL
jgi:uncharacterized protein YprB with RNaseH-like and TPR domain/predicted nuclease with RNAse H fold